MGSRCEGTFFYNIDPLFYRQKTALLTFNLRWVSAFTA